MPPLGPEDTAQYREWAAITRERTALRAELYRLKMETELAALRAEIEENRRLRLEIEALRSRSSRVQLSKQARVEREWQEHIRLCDKRRQEIAAQERHARCSDEEKYTWRPGKVADRHRLGATIRATPNFYDALGDADSSSTTRMQQPAPFAASPLTAPPSSPSPTSSTHLARGPPPSPPLTSSTRQVRGPPSSASTISSTSSAAPVATGTVAQRPAAAGRNDVQSQAALARQDKEQRQRSREIQAIYLREKYPERYGTPRPAGIPKPAASPPSRAAAAAPPAPGKPTDHVPGRNSQRFGR